MAKTILGKVTITPRGEYVPGEEYDRLDAVFAAGSSYISRVDNNTAPLTDTDAWIDLGRKGDKGDAYTFADFTPEQLATLRGERGDAFTFDDLSDEQKDALKGEPGVSVIIQEGVFREPGSAKDLPDLPDFADTQEGSAYVVDDDQTEGQYDLYIHSAKGRAWTIVNNWGGVPGPRGVKGDTGAVPVLESGTTDTGESGSPAEFRVEDMGLNKHGRPVHRIHAVLPQGIPGVRKGNVEVASEGLVAGRAYNFIPDNDDVPIGHFEEARTYWDGISGKPEITTRTYIDGADTALGERITAETVRATASETALDERIDSAKTSAETYTDRKLTGYLTEQETYSAIEERVRGELNDMGSVPTRADLPAVADDFDLYRIIDEDIDVYARNVESALAWKTLNFTIDMSRYETTAGAREKAQAALNSANAHTDEVGGELGGRVSALESGGMSVVVQAYGPVVQKALVFNVEKGGIFRGADVSVPVKVSSPSFSLISGIVSGIALSPDGLYLVVTGTYNPTFAFYKRSGSTYIKQPNPASLPGGGYNGCTFSPDGLYLAVAHDRSPCITICKREGDTLTKLPAPATLPTGSGRGVAFSPDGAYLAVALGGGSPFIAIYKREGDTFTKLDDPAVLPEGAGSGLGAAFSPDGLFLAIAHYTSPFLTIYKREGDTFTKLDDPAILPPDRSNGAAFSPDGLYLAVAHHTSPFLTIYKREGDMFTKLDDPAALPTGNGMSPVFSPNGPYLAVAHYTSPFLTIYKREGDTFTKLDGLAWPPANAGMGAAFSSDGTLLAVGHQGSPYISVYRIATALLNGLYVATQAGGAGDIIDAVELIAET